MLIKIRCILYFLILVGKVCIEKFSLFIFTVVKIKKKALKVCLNADLSG